MILFLDDQALIDEQCQNKFLKKEHPKKKQMTKSERCDTENKRKHRHHQHIWEGMAREPIIDENDVPQVDIGKMTIECKHCGALHWPKELMVYYFYAYNLIRKHII